MAKPTFITTMHPTFESEQSMKPEVNIIKFGDGYESRQGNGVNFKKQEWNLTFEGTVAQVEAAYDFLEAQGAVQAFYWTTPRNQTIVVVCNEWKMVRKPGLRTLTCTFRQVFES